MVWKLYNMEKETYTLQDLEYGKKKQKKIKNKKTVKNVENQKCTMQDLEYGQNTVKRGK